MAKEKMLNIDDKARFEEAYYLIGRCTEAFNLIVPVMPKNRDGIVSRIFLQFDTVEVLVFLASNDTRFEIKLQCLSIAKTALFRLQASFYSLVSGHACTIGQINTVIPLVREAYDQLSHWHKDTIKRATLQGEVKNEVTADFLRDFIRLFL